MRRNSLALQKHFFVSVHLGSVLFARFFFHDADVEFASLYRHHIFPFLARFFVSESLGFFLWCAHVDLRSRGNRLHGNGDCGEVGVHVGVFHFFNGLELDSVL